MSSASTASAPASRSSAALARPLADFALPGFLGDHSSLGGSRPVAAVFLFDTSYSMQYRVGSQTRLEEARQKALEMVDDLPDGSQVAVLDSAEAGGEWLASPALARPTPLPTVAHRMSSSARARNRA